MSEDIKKDLGNEGIDAIGAVDAGATAPLSDVEATAVMDAVEEPDTGGLDVLADGSAVGSDAVGAAAGIDAAAENAPIEGAASKKKGVIAAIVAVAIVAVVGIGAAFALQPASSGAEDPSGSASVSTTIPNSPASSGSSSSAAASKSSASSASSSAAASSGSAASDGSAGKADGSSGSSATSAGSGGTATGGAASGSGNASSGTTNGSTSGSGSTTTSSGGKTGSTGNTSNAGGSTSGGNANSTPAHTHNWVPITEPHTVIDQEEWDEPIYGTETHNFCSICGDIGFESLGDHGDRVHLNEYFSGGSKPVQVQVDTIHHAAVTHDETITVGYRCSECGAVK